jgi:hypothetical protein
MNVRSLGWTAIALTSLLAVPLAAPAATAGSSARAVVVTLGQIPAAPQPCGGGTASVWTQHTVGAGGVPYTVPGAGVITSFSNAAAATGGNVRFVLLGPGAGATDRVILAYSALVPEAANVVNTFPVRIPAPAGSSIGIFFDTNGMACAGPPTGDPSDVLLGKIIDPTLSTAYTAPSAITGRRLDLTAVWEPDADHDGFGDVSQDLCPQSALTQAACPAPDTTVTKAPKKRSSQRKAKIVFSSTVAGSTFTCAVDGKPAAPCTSPFKKRFKYGKHTVVITATSGFGIVDATPATVKFKVTRPRR